ncbi:MAG: helix-turn-helix domain-containing protein [Rikenellaceae bacterium]
MSIDEIMKNSGNTAIVINAEDLKTIIQQTVDKARSDALDEAKQIQEDEVYYSVQDVCRILNKKPVTLWRWKKRGYLIPASKVGNNPRYRKTDIDKLLNGQANE